MVSTDATVADLLASESVTLGDDDKLTPGLDTRLTESMTVAVTRIRVETSIRAETIAHDTTERNDADLTVGTRRTETEGVDGSQDVTYELTFTNGELTSEEVVNTVVTSEPVTEVVRVGTKPAPIQPAADPGASPGGAAAGLNWAALAQCESSGNPRAVNPAGYYGLYQFSLRTWASVGGSGNPIDASVEEQTNRAHILYNRSAPANGRPAASSSSASLSKPAQHTPRSPSRAHLPARSRGLRGFAPSCPLIAQTCSDGGHQPFGVTGIVGPGERQHSGSASPAWTSSRPTSRLKRLSGMRSSGRR